MEAREGVRKGKRGEQRRGRVRSVPASSQRSATQQMVKDSSRAAACRMYWKMNLQSVPARQESLLAASELPAHSSLLNGQVIRLAAGHRVQGKV
jgi:hypothetical protein